MAGAVIAALIIGLLGAVTPASAQTFQQTANFIFTGNPTTPSAEFGSYDMFAVATDITRADPSNCTIDLSMQVSGLGAGLFAAGAFPELAEAAGNSDPSKPVIVTAKAHVNLNAISSWRLGEPGAMGPGTTGITFNGTTDAVSTTVFSMDGVADPSMTCTSDCSFPAPASIDPDRWGKAMNYLFSAFCSGSSAAF